MSHAGLKGIVLRGRFVAGGSPVSIWASTRVECSCWPARKAASRLGAESKMGQIRSPAGER